MLLEVWCDGSRVAYPASHPDALRAALARRAAFLRATAPHGDAVWVTVPRLQ
jgi:hypothetical protein